MFAGVENVMLVMAALVAVVLEIGILIALGYGALRFATKFVEMRRDIEELKIAVRELRARR
jgi:hypothetical protein